MRTAMHLTTEQLLFQLIRRCQPTPVGRRRDVRWPRAEKVGRLSLAVAESLVPPDERRIAAARERTFSFLATRLRLDAHLNWGVRHGVALASFELQYMGHLRTLASAWSRERRAEDVALIAEQLRTWMATTASGQGDAWHPYCIAVRTIHWCELLILVGDLLPADVRDAAVDSLARQLDVLARRRERHLGANHLQRDDAALAIGGMLLEGDAARRWMATGLRGTWHALATHVLPDGMHFEGSPMYHAAMLDDVCRVITCCDALGVPVPSAARETLGRMARAAVQLSRPNGALHQFNDAEGSAHPPVLWLAARADTLSRRGETTAALQGPWLLPAAGYAGWRDDALGERLVFDAGPVGPRAQPGHAHCDALSFELDVAHQSFIVDAGVHGYDGDPFRPFSRSTAAHNTLMLNGEEQSEMWQTFRVARRARVEGPIVTRDPTTWAVSGRVRGFAGGDHRRRIVRLGGTGYRIEDWAQAATARAFLHFAPGHRVRVQGSVAVVSRADGWSAEITFAGVRDLVVVTGALEPVQGWHFPQFGEACPAPCLVASAVADASAQISLVTTIRWSGA
ncbi:MAG: heparinase II/III family protein [Gemmatimonadaceae bacterium]|nr:heparinase II/III family protein [Gemmatimonadaceae bacterium]